MVTTIGQLLVNEHLPSDLQDHSRVLTSKDADDLLERVAKEHPEKYREISHHLVQLGREASFAEGATLSLSDMLPPLERKELFDHVNQQTKKIMATDASDKEKQQAIETIYSGVQKKLTDDTYTHATAAQNPFALQVLSKARGNPSQLAALITTPGLYTDADDKIVPTFIQHSYAEGLSPSEYWAGTYGARKSVMATKFSVRSAGYLGKQFNQAVMKLQVTKDDCGTQSGIPVDVTDRDSVGAVLARDAGKFPSGSIVSKEMLAKLKADGLDQIVVRSPITCGMGHGLCKQCVGHRETGDFPKLGDHVGLNASSALAERLAQSALNCMAAGTLVRMADMSVRPIEQVKPGELVLGSDINGVTQAIRVLAVHDQGMQPVQEYTYRPGTTEQALRVVCTEEHPILSNTYESNCKEAALNDILRKLPAGYKAHHLYAVLATDTTVEGAVDEPLALLVGIWLGDGCRTVDGYPVVSCADLELARDLDAFLTPHGLAFKKCKRSLDWRVVNRGLMHDDNAPNKFKLVLRRLGLEGKYAHEKTVPQEVWTWRRSSVAALLAGYLATEDGVGVSFSSCSRELLTGIKELLDLRFCVRAGSISRIGKAGTGNRVHDMWAIYVTNLGEISRLATQLPRIPGVKGSRFEEYLQGVQYAGYQRDFYRCRRVLVSDAGVQHCYDLSVDHPDELFVLANGIICKNTKHSGGMKSDSGDKTFSGFDVIESFFQAPHAFPNRAAIATVPGKVEEVKEAPQGGYNITIGDKVHYALPDMAVKVKVGDVVEAGDQLSDGILNPKEVVEYKGLGEGRRYFMNRALRAFHDTNYAAHRRNVEILTRGIADSVRVDDPNGMGNYLPGDVASYSSVAASYVPRKDATLAEPSKSVGRYLEQPVLHHTIGTQLTKRTAKELESFGHTRVLTHQDKPQFTPQLLGLRDVPQYEEDWMAQLGSSYLKTNLLENAHRGAESHIHGLHPVPAIARGTELGKQVGEIGY